jgi:hypothetical protein
MTQFMLVIGSQPQNMGIVGQLIHEDDKFLKRIACELFTDKQIASCWFLEKDSVHDLFSDAERIFQKEQTSEKRLSDSYC